MTSASTAGNTISLYIQVRDPQCTQYKSKGIRITFTNTGLVRVWHHTYNIVCPSWVLRGRSTGNISIINPWNNPVVHNAYLFIYIGCGICQGGNPCQILVDLCIIFCTIWCLHIILIHLQHNLFHFTAAGYGIGKCTANPVKFGMICHKGS